MTGTKGYVWEMSAQTSSILTKNMRLENTHTWRSTVSFIKKFQNRPTNCKQRHMLRSDNREGT